MTKNNMHKNTARGYTLIEVLVGILIFAVGMLALAQLQSNLAQNSGDANARTIAMNMAEELIETDRTFAVLESNGVDDAYNDIVDEVTTEVRSGVLFTIDKEVTDYYYQQGSDAFTTTPPIGAAVSDFKKIDLTVTWNPVDADGNAAREFAIDQESTTTGALGSGSITINEVISSITSGAGGKASLGAAASSTYTPPVDYNPGQNPDIVSISLGDNKFKESTTPLPDVIRADELVETRFDVVTYSQISEDATFLRREEFIAVSCECTLKVPSLDGEGGLRPTVWNGEDYTEGELVAKPFGLSASNLQSQFCDICCRDHHDGGTGGIVNGDTGSALYNPFRPSEDYYGETDAVDSRLIGNHKHYHRDNTGRLELATQDGDRYVEACRLVRKDGFFRVAQDLNQKGLNTFPQNYLDDVSEVETYSDYVTTAVEDYYNNAPATLLSAATYGLSVEGDTILRPSVMSESAAYGGVSEQQLRSRGIYIDHMSSELLCKLSVLGGGSGDCDVPENVSDPLEIIPFYEVQLTWLSGWTETPSNFPVDVTNERILSDNSHSRGKAALMNQDDGYSRVNVAVHGGNLGLTGTDPIDERFSQEVAEDVLYVYAPDPNISPDLTSFRVVGQILSAVPGVKAADVNVTFDGAVCDRTLTGFECTIEGDASRPYIRLDNYFKRGRELYACSDLELKERSRSTDNPAGSYALFFLPTTISINVTIVIKDGGC